MAAWPAHAASGARQCDQRSGSALGGSPGAPQVSGDSRAGNDRGAWKRARRPWVKEATHLWQGVAPGSDGHTHRIFDRAHDWHARGRYFWTSGVARERSPDAGVESGMVTASRVPGEDQAVQYAGGACARTRARGLGYCLSWRLIFPSHYYQVVPWAWAMDIGTAAPFVCAREALLRLCCVRCAALFSNPELRLTTPRGLVRGKRTNAKGPGKSCQASGVRRQMQSERHVIRQAEEKGVCRT